MSLGGLVWEIVSNTVVTCAVPWLSEFVLQRILPLWQRYWPVIYQSVLVPAYHRVSDTIQPLLHDLLSNYGDSSAVSASESPPGGTSPLDPPQDHDSRTVSNVSNGLVSDHEDIIGTSLSEMHTPLDGGGTTESNIQGQASEPILNPTSNGSSDHKDKTRIYVSDSTTQNGGGTLPRDQNIHGRVSDPVLNPTTSMPSDIEDITRISTSESPTRSEGGTPGKAIATGIAAGVGGSVLAKAVAGGAIAMVTIGSSATVIAAAATGVHVFAGVGAVGTLIGKSVKAYKAKNRKIPRSEI